MPYDEETETRLDKAVLSDQTVVPLHGKDLQSPQELSFLLSSIVKGCPDLNQRYSAPEDACDLLYDNPKICDMLREAFAIQKFGSIRRLPELQGSDAKMTAF